MRRAVAGSAVSPSLRDTLLLRERALQATTVGVVISDLRLPDNPVVWVNAAFTATTGYAAEAAIGRNCRFLQGPDSDPTAVAEMRAAVKEQRASMVTLLNYRADGSTFWNSVSTAPVCDADGDVIGFIGIQVDVTDQVLARQEREALLRAEAPAVAAAPDETLALLARVSGALTAGDVNAMLAALAAQLVPAFADNCAIDLVPLEGPDVGDATRLLRVAAASTRQPETEVGDPALLARVVRTSRPISVVDHLAAPATGAGRRSEPEGPDAEGMLVVPLKGGGPVLGALTLVSAVRSRVYTDVHLAIALDIGRRAGLAVESARLREAEQRTAATLLAALSGALPEVPGLELTASGAGDAWLDVWPVPGGGAWIVAGVIRDSARPVTALAEALRVQRTIRDRSVASTDPVAVVRDLDDIWVGRLSASGQLTYAGGGASARSRRTDGRVDAVTGPATLEVGASLEIHRPSAASGPEGRAIPANAAPLLIARLNGPIGG